jgi:hypothetical protein
MRGFSAKDASWLCDPRSHQGLSDVNGLHRGGFCGDGVFLVMISVIALYPVEKDLCLAGFVAEQICLFDAIVLDVMDSRQRFQISAQAGGTGPAPRNPTHILIQTNQPGLWRITFRAKPCDRSCRGNFSHSKQPVII